MNRIELKYTAKAMVQGHRFTLWKAEFAAIAINLLVSTVLQWASLLIVGGAAVGQVMSDGDTLAAMLPGANALISSLSIAISAPLAMGVIMYYRQFSKESFADINVVFAPLKKTFKIFVTTIFVNVIFVSIMIVPMVILIFALGFSGATSMGLILFVLFLSAIPSIIIGLGFSIMPYIFMKHPELGIMDIVSTSWKLMKGHKRECFVLQLSFMGWMMLGIITCGIALLWVVPYNQMSFVLYYDQIDDAYFGTASMSESEESIKVSEEATAAVVDTSEDTPVESVDEDVAVDANKDAPQGEVNQS